jgi:hypothetical protein
MDRHFSTSKAWHSVAAQTPTAGTPVTIPGPRLAPGQPTGAQAAVRPPTAVDDPKVTVGIPTFNRAEWLRGAIESVLAQSYTRFHIIVSDNASTDETPDVVRAFGDPRITYVRSEQNLGAVGNINRLIGLADTEYVVLLPDDDFFYAGYLEAAVGLLDRFDNVGVVHSAFNHVDADKRVIRQVDALRCRSRWTIERSDRLLERLMVASWWLCFASTMYRTDALVAAGGLCEDRGYFCDHDLWLQLASKWDFGYLAEPLVGQRDHAHTVSWKIVTENGLEPGTIEAAQLYANIGLQLRMNFIDNAGFEPARADRLRALATLQSIVDLAHEQLPSSEVAARLARLVRAYPRILSSPGFWRLVAAQCGARRVRAMLTTASASTSRFGKTAL